MGSLSPAMNYNISRDISGATSTCNLGSFVTNEGELLSVNYTGTLSKNACIAESSESRTTIIAAVVTSLLLIILLTGTTVIVALVIWHHHRRSKKYSVTIGHQSGH